MRKTRSGIESFVIGGLLVLFAIVLFVFAAVLLLIAPVLLLFAILFTTVASLFFGSLYLGTLVAKYTRLAYRRIVA